MITAAIAASGLPECLIKYKCSVYCTIFLVWFRRGGASRVVNKAHRVS